MSCIPAKEIKKKKNLIAMCFWFQIEQISIGSSQFLFDKKKKEKEKKNDAGCLLYLYVGKILLSELWGPA